jgi:hypothetical protein
MRAPGLACRSRSTMAPLMARLALLSAVMLLSLC